MQVVLYMNSHLHYACLIQLQSSQCWRAEWIHGGSRGSNWMKGHGTSIKLTLSDIHTLDSPTVSSSSLLPCSLMTHAWFHSHPLLISVLQFGRRFNYWCGLCQNEGIICEPRSWEQEGATCHPVMCCSLARQLGKSNNRSWHAQCFCTGACMCTQGSSLVFTNRCLLGFVSPLTRKLCWLLPERNELVWFASIQSESNLYMLHLQIYIYIQYINTQIHLLHTDISTYVIHNRSQIKPSPKCRQKLICCIISTVQSCTWTHHYRFQDNCCMSGNDEQIVCICHP